MTDREDLIRVAKGLVAVRGCVILASGKETDYYADMRRATLNGAASPLVRRVMSELATDLGFSAVGGLTLGADPVVTAMLRTRAIAGGRSDAFVVCKKAKSHGLQRHIEDTDVTGWRVLVVEDTSTTGGSTLTAVEAVRWIGGEVVAVAVVVDHAARAAERVAKADLEYCYTIGLKELGL